jgi:hypothetical protein
MNDAFQMGMLACHFSTRQKKYAKCALCLA